VVGLDGHGDLEGLIGQAEVAESHADMADVVPLN
jgi:hypothetical protein